MRLIIFPVFLFGLQHMFSNQWNLWEEAATIFVQGEVKFFLVLEHFWNFASNRNFSPHKSIPKLSNLKTYNIWHGDYDIADVANHAGFWVDPKGISHNEPKLFDDEPNSLWHSAVEYKDKDKIIGFEFKVIIFFRFFTLFPLKHLARSRCFSVFSGLAEIITVLFQGAYWILFVAAGEISAMLSQQILWDLPYYRWRWGKSKLHQCRIWI